MVYCKCIYVHHLTTQQTEAQICQAFQRKFESAITGQDEYVTVRLYTPVEGKRSATINGFTVHVRKMRELGEFMRVGSIDARLKADVGHERQEDGCFVSPASSGQRAKHENQFGFSNRNIDIFTPCFSQLIMPEYLRIFTNYIHLKNVKIGTGAIGRISGHVDLMYLKKKDKSVLEFRSALLAGQAICALNKKNVCWNHREYQLQVLALDSEKELEGTFAFDGFGCNGRVIKNFIELHHTHGYIPLEVFPPNDVTNVWPDTDLEELCYQNPPVDIAWLRDIKVICWKCETLYKIIGVDMLLNFVAGICEKCKYQDWPRQEDYIQSARQGPGFPLGDPRNEETAFKWQGENFTRLTLDSTRQQGGFHIFHHPLPVTCENKEEYRSLIVPLLTQEWNDGLEEYKDNSTYGKIIQKDLIPSRDREPGSPNLYAATVQIRSSEFWEWESGNIARVSMDIMCGEKDNPISLGQTKSKLFGLKKLSDSVTHIFVQLKLTDRVANSRFWLICHPKPSKTEYMAKVNLLNKWKKGSLYDHHLNKLVLGIETENCYEMDDYDLLNWWWSNNFFQNSRVTEIKKSLNESQLEAMRMAFLSNASIIIGPPGTGKTTTASKTIGFLATVERSVIVACAATNYASDELSDAIHKTALKYGLELKVLRVLAPGKALRKANSSSPYPALHELVKNEPTYLQGKQFLRYKKDIEEGQHHRLPEDVMKTFHEHVQELEHQVMNRYNVISCTAQSLADQRVQEWAKATDKIGTVVIDEAAQLSEANTLLPLTLEADRIVFFGDHNQLNSTVTSISAEEGGLGRSLQETLAETLNGIPTKMLLTQYRMHPDIANFVSNFQYEGRLEHGPNVLERGQQMQNVLDTMTQIKNCKRVIAADFKFKMEMVGTSCKNNQEAEAAVHMTERLMELGIHANEIVILTMYSGQNKLITEMLMQKGVGVNVCNTVAFQGKESRVIILCLTRGEREDGAFGRSVGFLATPNRLNVAISRAQEALFILCNVSYFKKNPNDVVQRFTELLSQYATIIPAEILNQ